MKVSIFTKGSEYYTYLDDNNKLPTYKDINKPNVISLYDLDCISVITVTFSDITKVTLKDTDIELDLVQLK
jgi:hypothetical protein